MKFTKISTIKIFFSFFAMIMIVALFCVKDNLSTANAAIRVAEAEIIAPQPTKPIYDFFSDDSYQKYLSAETPFNNPEYVPEDLLPIDSAFTANTSKTFKLRQEAGIQFADMAWHFWNEFKGDKLWIMSAYRSNEMQESMLKKGCPRKRCAQAGASEHQAGLAIDLKVISKGGKSYNLFSGNKYYQRFANNAHKRGFHNTYQKGIDIDGQMIEGRHRRYVGTGLATILREQGKSFAEYYNENIENTTTF